MTRSGARAKRRIVSNWSGERNTPPTMAMAA